MAVKVWRYKVWREVLAVCTRQTFYLQGIQESEPNCLKMQTRRTPSSHPNTNQNLKYLIDGGANNIYDIRQNMTNSLLFFVLCILILFYLETNPKNYDVEEHEIKILIEQKRRESNMTVEEIRIMRESERKQMV